MIEKLFQLFLILSFQAAVMGVLIWVVTMLLGKQLTPQFKYMIWLLVFVRLALPINIASDFSLFNYIGIEQIAKSTSQAVQMKNNPASMTNTVSVELEESNTNTKSETKGPVAVSEAENPQSRVALDWFRILSYSWLAVVLSALVYLLWNFLTLKINIYKKQCIGIPQNYEEAIDACLDEMGVFANTEVVFTSHTKVPFVFGFFKPLIVLPEGLVDLLSLEEFTAIVRHEAMHIKLNHHKIKMITYSISILHWFNPFVWLFLKSMQNEAEFYCDNAVMLRSNKLEEEHYLSALLEIAKRKQTNFIPAHNFGQSNLRRRVISIMNRKSIPNYAVALSVMVTVVLSMTLFTSAMPKATETTENIVESSAENKSVASEPPKNENTNIEPPSVAEITAPLSPKVDFSTAFTSPNVTEIAENIVESVSGSQSVANELPGNENVVLPPVETTASTESARSFDAKNIHTLDIQADTAIVKFVKSDNDTITVDVEMDEKYNEYYKLTTKTVGDNKLTISLKTIKNFPSNIPFSSEYITLTIAVPRNDFAQLNMILNASSIVLDSFTIGELTITSNAGNVKLTNNILGTLDYVNNAGKFSLDANTIEGDVNAINNAGNFILNTDTIDFALALVNNAGKATIDLQSEVEDLDLRVKSTMGSVELPAEWNYEKKEANFNTQYKYILGNGNYKANIENSTGVVTITN